METVFDAFRVAVRQTPDKPFLCLPANADTPQRDITFAAVSAQVDTLLALYRAAGFGVGDRVATLLSQRAEFVLHFLALNALGTTIIPINPDNLAADIAYFLDHSEAVLVLTEQAQLEAISGIAQGLARAVPVLDVDALPAVLPPRSERPPRAPDRSTICSILYTSGTTGRPKGCMLSNDTHLLAGECYRDLGGALAMRYGEERFFNITPFHHVNLLVVNLTCCLLTSNCVILVPRFSPSRWWDDVRATAATVIHYVGMVPSLLMNQPPRDDDRDHNLRFAFGAGVEPTLHAAFEARFGVSLVEIWGMTETPRVFADNIEPREVGTRAFGRPRSDYQALVVDDDGKEVPRGTAGELLVRYNADNPRRGFFSGYLKDSNATEESWRSTWFSTGDMVIKSENEVLHFVDRKKNIIRRAGENISAAEVEAVVVAHPAVRQVAVIAVKDELRDEEVMACIVLANEYMPDRAMAEGVYHATSEKLAYFKCPAWIIFLPSLPTTSSQRLQKTRIFPPEIDPRRLAGTFDLHHLKRRRLKSLK